jgi:hypothetical protein
MILHSLARKEVFRRNHFKKSLYNGAVGTELGLHLPIEITNPFWRITNGKS